MVRVSSLNALGVDNGGRTTGVEWKEVQAESETCFEKDLIGSLLLEEDEN